MTKSGESSIGRCRPNLAKRPHSIDSELQSPGRSCYETESSALPQRIASGSRQPTKLSAKCRQSLPGLELLLTRGEESPGSTGQGAR
jgi:hypothetical protein